MIVDGGPSVAAPVTDPLVEVSFAAPKPQRRWTVAIRLIMLVPHFVVGLFYAIGGAVAVVAGWFSALALGRLPDGIRTFLGNLLRYYSRVYGYAYLLDDTYPTFDLAATDGAVQVRLPDVQPLNRAAVFVRIVVAIPSWFIISVVGQGILVFLVFGWLISLITGKLPTPLYGAFAAFLRYTIRFWAFFGLLTSEYPRGLYGDKSWSATPPLPPAPPPPGADGFGAPAGTTLIPPPPAAGAVPYGADDVAPSIPPPPPPPRSNTAMPLGPPVGAAAPAGLTEAPRITKLSLTRGAKAVLVVSLIVGLVSQVVIGIQGAQANAALNELDRGYQALVDETFTYLETLQRCSFSDGSQECSRAAAEQYAPAFDRLERDLERIDFPGGTAALARDLRDRVRDASVALEALAVPSPSSAIDDAFTTFEFRLREMDEAYFALRAALGATG